MIDDLALMIAIAQSHATHGKPPKYIPALELAYARTIAYLAEMMPLPAPPKEREER